MSLRRKRLYGFTAIVLLVLTLLPATGWLVRSQVLGTLGLGFSVSKALWGKPEGMTAQEQFAQKHPNDAAIQLATLNYAQPGKERLARLAKIQAAHPKNLMVNALYLRLACDLVSVGHNEEQNSLSPQKNDIIKPETLDPEKNRPEDLARFVQIARDSETLDPSNAYFPMMQAVGLLAQSCDAEAIATLKRAGEMTVYNEYLSEEVNARWDTANATYGQEIGGIGRSALYAATLFPHYATIRAMGRTMTGIAIESELQGKQAEGLAIRKAVTRIGAVMRAESPSVISGLVGSAITNISIVRPGGAEALVNRQPSTDQNGEKIAQARLDAYTAYLTTLGEQQEVAFVRSEVDEQKQGREIWKQANNKTWFFTPAIDCLFPLWGVAGALTSSIVGVVVFGGLFALLNRFSKRIRAGETMSAETQWGIWLALLSLVSALAVSLLVESLADGAFFVFALPGVFLLTIPLIKRFKANQWGKGLGTMALTLLFIGVLGLVSWFPLRGLIDSMSLLQGLSGGSYTDASSGTDGTSSAWLGMVIVAGFISLIAFSLLLLIGLAITSRVLRVPVSVGVTRSYHKIAGPVIALLLIGYAGLTCVTAHYEQEAIQALKQMVRHEGRYVASTIGKEWPAATPRP